MVGDVGGVSFRGDDEGVDDEENEGESGADASVVALTLRNTILAGNLRNNEKGGRLLIKRESHIKEDWLRPRVVLSTSTQHTQRMTSEAELVVRIRPT